MGKESVLQRRVIKWAKENWVTEGKDPELLIRKNQSGPFGKSGFPDYDFFADGVMFMIEFKAPGGKASEIQKLRISQLDAMRFPVLLSDDFDECCAFIHTMMRLAKYFRVRR